MPEPDALERLFAEGYLRREGDRVRTTARWQAASARAALRLQQAGAPFGDLRLPIAAALAERHGDLDDGALADLVEAMLPIEEAELEPAFGPAPAGAR